MNRANYVRLAVITVILIGTSLQVADAQAPASPPTIWSSLGIPQGFQKMRDTSVNRRGNRPNLERKPPLKRIADPANLESENPAIKAAAKIKTEEDLAPQKIKAIKYLAEVGCGCYPGVADALVKALDDCTEEVRYQAAIALCQASGNPCNACGGLGCCSAAVMTKLQEKAHGQDAQGCPKESSARVRAAAQNALNACRRLVPGSPVIDGGKIEYPREAPPVEVPPEGPGTLRGMEPTPANGQPPIPPLDGQPPVPPGDKTSAIIRPISLAAMRPAAGGPAPDATAVSYSGECRQGCTAGPGQPGGTGPQVGPDGGAGPSDLAGDMAAPSPDYLAGSFGAAAGPRSFAPHMIGDFFGGGGVYINDSGFLIGPVPSAGGDRRFKIAENNSPVPVDRVFFTYNHFQGALRAPDGTHRSLDRYTFGVEKTFLNGWCSLDLRIPFATGLASNQYDVPTQSVMGTEFGNVALAFKGILHETDRCALTAGLGVVFPTGDDGSLTIGTDQLVIKNEAFHLQPFLGWLWTPGDRWFFEAFAQVDLDANGNSSTLTRLNLPTVYPGDFYDQNLLFLDFNFGYYIYKNSNAYGLTGIAPVCELHYTTTLQDTRVLTMGNGDEFLNPDNRMDILNITGGVHFDFGRYSTLTVAAVAPLRGGREALFDAEVNVQFNRRF